MRDIPQNLDVFFTDSRLEINGRHVVWWYLLSAFAYLLGLTMPVNVIKPRISQYHMGGPKMPQYL